MKKTLFLIVVCTVLAVPGMSHALLGLVSLDAAAGGSYLTPSGNLQYDGDKVDLEDSLGFEKQVFGTARVRLELPLVIPNVYLAAIQMKFDDKVSGSDFTFGNQSYTAGDSTSLDFNEYDAAFFYGIPLIGVGTLGKLNIDVGLNLRMIDLEAEIQGASVSENQKETIYAPMLFVAAQFKPIDMIALEAEVRALSIGDADVLSAIGRIRYNSFGPLFFTAGYRYEDISVDTDDLDVDLELGGPFLEVGVGF